MVNYGINFDKPKWVSAEKIPVGVSDLARLVNKSKLILAQL